MTIHPRYSGIQDVFNNYALLHLKEEFILDEHLDTICLPEHPNLRDGNYNKSNCVTMGWGKNAFESDEYQRSMKQVMLPIVDNDKCQELLRETRLGSSFDLNKSFLCAGGGDGDACEGDGGGPLVCPKLSAPNEQ